ncbi:MAG: ACP phosphodiesterase [Flavobacteriales bacterium]
MNFLAHAWLSGDNAMVMAANVTGDAFKGSIGDHFPAHFKAGLQLHRFIDRYTDTHADFKQAVTLLKPFYGRYSGVALDVWLDYILASEFHLHHSNELRFFTNRVYQTLTSHTEWMNAEARGIARFMIDHDWLYQYASRNYMENVMERMAKRFEAPALANGGHPPMETLEQIRLIFNQLSNELVDTSNKKLVELLNL